MPPKINGDIPIKRRRVNYGRHTWTLDEERAILQYAKDELIKGNGFEVI